MIRGFRLARQVGEIHADDAEAPAVALRPFEIVEQRPDEIAAQLDARRKRALRRHEMIAKIGGPFGIMNQAVTANNVVITGAVFGDVYVGLAVAVALTGSTPRSRLPASTGQP